MGAKITLMGPEWISLDGSLPKVQEPCYFLDRENVFRGVMDESGDVYEILDNDTNDVVYHSNIEDGYIVFFGNSNLRRIFMAYLAVNRDGEELVFNDCPIYDRVEDTWKIPMLRWELVYDDPDDHSAGVHEDEVRDDDYGVTLPNGTIERIIGGLLTFANEPIEIVTIKSHE